MNLRDVASASPVLRRDVLLRSDAPLVGDVHDYTAIGVCWPPATVVDLRDEVEVGDGHPLATELPVLSYPVLDGAIGRATEPLHQTLEEMYSSLLRQPSAGWLAKAITAIALEPTPVLVHCTAGKDRTGATIALALSLVGVSPEEIVADYALSHDTMPLVQRRMRKRLGLPVESDEPPHPIPQDLYGARAEAMAFLLTSAQGWEGGVVGWFLASGGAEETIEALRSRLLA